MATESISVSLAEACARANAAEHARGAAQCEQYNHQTTIITALRGGAAGKSGGGVTCGGVWCDSSVVLACVWLRLHVIA